ncbi:allantoate deiminase [Inediibacterium massiliense]|uniref:allantoate deiminase n=1 Tax=Inediibacterium massiliense TaxID=1658111 RepID=UPI0006B59163|nr:allantoate deiminase [Inediibacterium massiliense]
MDGLLRDVQKNMEWISEIGSDSSGGITRLLYSESWMNAQKGLQKKFEEIGLETKFDAVGNLFGEIKGSKHSDEIIMSGSHVDTVVNGGKLDSQFGIIGAFLAIKYLLMTKGRPYRTLQVVSLAEEEGSRFPYTFWGSKNIFGLANAKDVMEIRDVKGVLFSEAMKKAGFDFSCQKKQKDMGEYIKAFIELHIEQGNVLEMNNQSVGIVTGIVGQRRYNITLKGQSNHAGTTPMQYRKDTVYAFSKICSQSIERAKKLGDPLVLTFGKAMPKPNTVNVVPGEILFTMDCRHTDQEVLTNFTRQIEIDMKRIADELGIEIEINLWMDEPPVPMDEKLIQMLQNICEKEKMDYRVMHSGAGHDSQIFAPKVPTGMIFVPSIGGISHNPAEDTKLEDLVQGVKTLYQALYELAY